MIKNVKQHFKVRKWMGMRPTIFENKFQNAVELYDTDVIIDRTEKHNDRDLKQKPLCVRS